MRGISVLRNEQHLLRDVSIELRRGEAVLLTGPNGAGKTTLLRVVAGLMPVDEGEGIVLGARFPLDGHIRRRISASLDEPALWPWMNADRVIRTVMELRGERCRDSAAALAEVGLSDRQLGRGRRKHVRRFSQGMRKRLQVACSLAVESDLLVIDEPTAGLDKEGSERIWLALEARRESGASLIVATHDAEGAESLEARVVRMDRGVLADDRG